MRIKYLLLLFSLISYASFAQTHPISIGLNYGLGNEIRNRNYTFSNQYIKGEFYYLIKKGKNFEYQFLVQPEFNYATHQLLNLYFVQPDENNYQEKRARFTQLQMIHEYVLGLGFLIRKPILNNLSIYTLLSTGPMFTDTETERLSKGFAFSDVLALGITARFHQFNLDLRPSFRHNSNAGLQKLNSGINTLNLETGIYYQLHQHEK